jgi:hypothetical protein
MTFPIRPDRTTESREVEGYVRWRDLTDFQDMASPSVGAYLGNVAFTLRQTVEDFPVLSDGSEAMLALKSYSHVYRFDLKAKQSFGESKRGANTNVIRGMGTLLIAGYEETLQIPQADSIGYLKLDDVHFRAENSPISALEDEFAPLVVDLPLFEPRPQLRMI